MGQADCPGDCDALLAYPGPRRSFQSWPQAQALSEGEHLLAPVPQGFVLGHQAEDASGVIQEFVPEGESVQAWSQMMTVRIFHDMAGASPRWLFTTTSWTWYLQACPSATAQEIAGGRNRGRRST
jgi:hypothetical protein